MRTTNTQSIRRLVGTAVLAAVVIVLQLIAGGIKIGPFTITLALVPIILGAVLFGPASGGFLGAMFGAVVCYSVVTGADPGGYLMFEQNPVLTLFLCLLKSTAAGVAAGWIYRLLAAKEKPTLGVILSAIACPICNTGILCIGMLAFYNSLVTGWAIGEGYSNALAYIILGMLGLNFIVELTINLVLSPVILRVIDAVKKKLN